MAQQAWGPETGLPSRDQNPVLPRHPPPHLGQDLVSGTVAKFWSRPPALPWGTTGQPRSLIARWGDKGDPEAKGVKLSFVVWRGLRSGNHGPREMNQPHCEGMSLPSAKSRSFSRFGLHSNRLAMTGRGWWGEAERPADQQAMLA